MPFARASSLGVLSLLLLTAACEQPQQPPPPAPPEVTVAAPERRDVDTYYEFTGQTDAFEKVEVRARVRGLLEAVHYTPAGQVRAGDLLFTIEDEDYLATRDQGEAEVRSWESELARAQSDLERLEEAVQSNAVSVQEVDRARADRDQAEASLMGARARLVQAELNLSYTKITAPISGRVNRWFVDPGNLVGVNDSTLLTTVTRMAPVYAYFDMSEALVLDLLRGVRAQRSEGRGGAPPRPGEVPAYLGLGDDEGWPHEGWIDYLDSSVDPGTGTIKVRGEFPNDDGVLFPGLFARIRVNGDPIPDAVLVAESAIGADLGGKYVYVVGSDNVVELRHVQLGQLEGDMRVIVEGLDHGERYIVSGIQRARPGMPVTPRAGS